MHTSCAICSLPLAWDHSDVQRLVLAFVVVTVENHRVLLVPVEALHPHLRPRLHLLEVPGLL